MKRKERFRVRPVSRQKRLSSDYRSTIDGACRRAEALFNAHPARPVVVLVERTTAPKNRPSYIIPQWDVLMTYNQHGWHEVSMQTTGDNQ